MDEATVIKEISSLQVSVSYLTVLNSVQDFRYRGSGGNVRGGISYIQNAERTQGQQQNYFIFCFVTISLQCVYRTKGHRWQYTSYTQASMI